MPFLQSIHDKKEETVNNRQLTALLLKEHRWKLVQRTDISRMLLSEEQKHSTDEIWFQPLSLQVI